MKWMSIDMFEGLNAIPWHEFSHAHGSAEEVPVWIRQLASTNKRVRQDAINKLSGAVCHQGFNCDMTVYVVPFLIELLQEASVQGKEEVLELLALIYEDATAAVKDVQIEAIVDSSFALYLSCLDDPDRTVRMWTVRLLSLFTKQRAEVRSALQRVFEREAAPLERANLLLGLENILVNTPEERNALLVLIQNHEHDLVAFAAAWVLTRLAKNETPQNVVEFLGEIMLCVPDTLSGFFDLPLGAWPERYARHVLYKLERQRLEFLVPAVLDRWPEASEDAYTSLEWAEFLLFALFQKQASPLPASQLTAQQRHILELFCANQSTHRDNNFWKLLKSYGLPDSTEALASYLALDVPHFPPEESHAPRLMENYLSVSIIHRGAQVDDATIAAIEDTLLRFPHNLLFLKSADSIPKSSHTDDLFFRFPQNVDAIDQIKWEVSLLRFLVTRLPVPVPCPIYFFPASKEYMPFMGYMKFSGMPLSKDALACIDGEETIQHVADQLGSFLFALHSVPCEEQKHGAKTWYRIQNAPGMPALPIRHQYEVYETLFALTQSRLFPHLLPERREHIQACFAAFFSAPRLQRFALIHNNLISENILYDVRTRQMSGILDFRQVGVGDPASDIANLLILYGEDFVWRCARVYPTLELFLERARFYALVSVLQKAIVYLAHQDMEAFHYILTSYPV